ncbi:MAG: hypothetical protein D3907_02820 [Candidatus Electrothrix sp. AUS3]|nr:hypothetical protein [Candidatus Electrothrix gigas]
MKIIPIIMRKSSDKADQELANVIASNIPDSLIYQKQRRPGIYAATGDWMVVLSVSSSVITIGSAIWAAYKSLTKDNSDKNERVLIQFQDDNGNHEQIVIDGDSTKEIVIEKVKQTIETRRINEKTGQEEINTIERSGTWLRRK